MYHGSLISLYLCLHIVIGTFQDQGPIEPMVAMLGGDAELSCSFLPHQNVKNMKISWTRSLSSEVVHLYEDGRDKLEEAMEQYFRRTKLVTDYMYKGIVVLRILNVRLSDNGLYHCAIQHGSYYSDTVIELKVAALGSHPQFHVEVTKSRELQLECKSEGWFPQPKVQWMDSEGGEIPAESETHTQDKGGLFHVTTSVLLRETSQKNLIYSIWNPVVNQKKEEQLSTTVAEPINTTVIAVVAALPALLMLLIFIGLYYLKIRLKNQYKTRSSKHQHHTHRCMGQAIYSSCGAYYVNEVEPCAECDPEGASDNAPGTANEAEGSPLTTLPPEQMPPRLLMQALTQNLPGPTRRGRPQLRLVTHPTQTPRKPMRRRFSTNPNMTLRRRQDSAARWRVSPAYL